MAKIPKVWHVRCVTYAHLQFIQKYFEHLQVLFKIECGGAKTPIWNVCPFNNLILPLPQNYLGCLKNRNIFRVQRLHYLQNPHEWDHHLQGRSPFTKKFLKEVLNCCLQTYFFSEQLVKQIRAKLISNVFTAWISLSIINVYMSLKVLSLDYFIYQKIISGLSTIASSKQLCELS